MKQTAKTYLDSSESLCPQNKYKTNKYNWFPELEDYIEEENSRKVCFQCPVQFECAQTALNNREAWGIWGGMEPFKMRRALGLDEFGEDRVLSKELICPFCNSNDLCKAKKKTGSGYLIECNYCSIEWKSYKIPDKVRKTLRRTYDNDLGRSVGNS